jgi:hypothetical protein
MQCCTDTRGPPIYFLLPQLQQGSAKSAQPSTTGRHQTPQIRQTVCVVAPRYPNVQCSSAQKVCTRTHSIILGTALNTQQTNASSHAPSQSKHATPQITLSYPCSDAQTPGAILCTTTCPTASGTFYIEYRNTVQPSQSNASSPAPSQSKHATPQVTLSYPCSAAQTPGTILCTPCCPNCSRWRRTHAQPAATGEPNTTNTQHNAVAPRCPEDISAQHQVTRTCHQ